MSIIKHLQSLAFALLLTISAAAIWSFASSIAFAPLSPLNENERKWLMILRNGTPIVCYQDQKRKCSEYSDLSGESIYDGKRKLESKYADVFSDEMPNVSEILIEPPIKMPNKDGCANLDPTIRVVEVHDISLEAPRWLVESWYFVHDNRLHGHGYFVGYKDTTKDRRLIGYIDRDGFGTKEPSQEKMFCVSGIRAKIVDEFFHAGLAESLYLDQDKRLRRVDLSEYGYRSFGPGNKRDDGPLYLLADDGLVRVDLFKREIKWQWKDAGLLSIQRAYRNKAKIPTSIEAARSPSMTAYLARFKDRIEAVDTQLKPIQTYPLPEEMRDRRLRWIQFFNNSAIVEADTGTPTHKLYWFDASGRITRRETVDLECKPKPEQIAEYRRESTRYFVLKNAICGIVPTYLTIKFYKGDPTIAATNRTIAWSATCLFSLFWVSLCFRRQQRYDASNTWHWLLFVFLFGGLGYFGYRLHRRWPPMVPCSHCGRKSPRDRVACCRCGGEFPAPSPKGFEICVS